MSAGERQPLARNMSAPPRSVLTFRPVVPAAPVAEGSAASGTGLHRVCRLDISWSRRRLPAVISRDLAAAGGRQSRSGIARLALALTLTEESGGPRTSVDACVWARVSAMSEDALADELREVARRVHLAPLGFPSFGLFVAAREAPHPVERSMRVTVAVLARRRGMVFLRDAEPLALTPYEDPPLDLWSPLPVAAQGVR